VAHKSDNFAQFQDLQHQFLSGLERLRTAKTYGEKLDVLAELRTIIDCQKEIAAEEMKTLKSVIPEALGGRPARIRRSE
jgi:hypothetical protein